MKKIGLILIVLLSFQTSFAQNEKAKMNMLHVPVADTIMNPVILVLHSMGDVNVKGHQGAELLVYAQELLPSVSDLAKQSQEQVFSFIDKRTKSPVMVRRNNNFSVEQRDNFFQVETNVFAFNNHVFVMAPERSSVVVHSRDIGNISIENFLGDAEAEANAGNIFIKDIDGVINATTLYGDVVADVSKESEIKPLFISTLMGSIEIIAPSNAQNTVLLSSEQGNLKTNFNTVNTINVAAGANSNKNRSRVFNLNGGGGSEFILNTFKGDIILRHQEN